MSCEIARKVRRISFGKKAISQTSQHGLGFHLSWDVTQQLNILVTFPKANFDRYFGYITIP